MQAIYHVSLNEIDLNFINSIKKQFQNAKVDIVIKQMDETDYLNSSEKNRAYLQEAIKEVDESKFITKTIEELGL